MSPLYFTACILQPTRLPKKYRIMMLINMVQFCFYSGYSKSQILDHLLKFVTLKEFLKKLPMNENYSFECNYKLSTMISSKMT